MGVCKPLVVTPAPKPTESFPEYFLRLAEANGYDTPYTILKYAGLTQDNMLALCADPAHIGPLVGWPDDVLAHLRRTQSNDASPDDTTLLGQRVPRWALRTMHPALCPQCVIEDGSCDALWQLRQVIGCPRHGTRLLMECRSCNKPLSWFRPGLLTCKCGADYSGMIGEALDRPTIELLGVVSAKLHGRHLAPDSTLPVRHLDAMSLRTLLFLIAKLGQCNARDLESRGSRVQADQIRHAADVLADWPGRYFQMLQRFGVSYAATADTTSVRKQFEKFFSRLFQAGLPGREIAFLRGEFVQFGLQHWGKGTVDPRMVRNVGADIGQAAFVHQAEFARRVGITQSAVRTLRRKGLVETVNGRAIIDFAAAQSIVSPAVAHFGERRAAHYIGLPMRVLRDLRRTGDCHLQPLPRFPDHYRQDDLDDLRTRVLASRAHAIGHDGQPLISVRQAMMLTYFPIHGKADIIRQLIRGTLQPAQASDTINDIWLVRQHVEQLRREARQGALEGTLSAAEAAREIGCCPTVIDQLGLDGYIAPLTVKDAIRFEASSVRSFFRAYEPVSRTAERLGTSSRMLVSKCRSLDIPLPSINRKGTGIPQCFVPRSAMTRLPALCAR